MRTAASGCQSSTPGPCSSASYQPPNYLQQRDADTHFRSIGTLHSPIMTGTSSGALMPQTRYFRSAASSYPVHHAGPSRTL